MKANKKFVSALAAVVVAVPLSGCSLLVHQWELEEMNARMAEHEAADQAMADRMAQLEAMTSDMSSQIEALQAELSALAGEFDALTSSEWFGMGLALPVNFGFDSADIRSENEAMLDRFAAAINEHYPDVKITLEGSTDASGSPAYNNELAMRRAEAVKSYLVSSGGLNGDNIMTVALGESRLLSDAVGDDGTMNRRVTFVVEWAGGM